MFDLIEVPGATWSHVSLVSDQKPRVALVSRGAVYFITRHIRSHVTPESNRSPLPWWARTRASEAFITEDQRYGCKMMALGIAEFVAAAQHHPHRPTAGPYITFTLFGLQPLKVVRLVPPAEPCNASREAAHLTVAYDAGQGHLLSRSDGPPDVTSTSLAGASSQA